MDSARSGMRARGTHSFRAVTSWQDVVLCGTGYAQRPGRARYRNSGRKAVMLSRIASVHALAIALLAAPAVVCGSGCLASDDTGASESMVKEIPAAVVIDET